MNDTKAILASRTVWTNLIGLISVGLAIVGVDTGNLDVDKAADALAPARRRRQLPRLDGLPHHRDQAAHGLTSGLSLQRLNGGG
jgi:hypothetical protein